MLEQNEKYGFLTVIKYSHKDRHQQPYYLVRCVCGTEKSVREYRLKSGNTKSCGCMKKYHPMKHGMHNTPIYAVWEAMVQRCCNPKCKAYKNYGGRGISICKEWRESFLNFYNDMGERPSSKHTLERINVNGNYEPSNCKWATWKEQSLNKRIRSNQYIRRSQQV